MLARVFCRALLSRTCFFFSSGGGVSYKTGAQELLGDIAQIVEVSPWDNPEAKDVEAIALPLAGNATPQQQQRLLDGIEEIFPETSREFVFRAIPGLGTAYVSEDREAVRMSRVLWGIRSEYQDCLLKECSNWTCEQTHGGGRIILRADLGERYTRRHIEVALKSLGIGKALIQFSRDNGPLFIRGEDDLSKHLCEGFLQWLQVQEGVNVTIKPQIGIQSLER